MKRRKEIIMRMKDGKLEGRKEGRERKTTGFNEEKELLKRRMKGRQEEMRRLKGNN